MALNVAKDKGLAKILAEPTLTTLTGQEAKFLSGGEFPIPVPQGLDTVTIEFKEFGVGLRFIPVVMGGGVINLKLNIDVSELADSNNVLIESGCDTVGLYRARADKAQRPGYGGIERWSDHGYCGPAQRERP